MRERLDFASISAIILTNAIGSKLTQTEYFLTLFDYSISQIENGFEESNIRKYISGERNVPSTIIEKYEIDIAKEKLEEDIEKVLDCLSDKYFVIEKIRQVIVYDNSISPEKRNELLENINFPSKFIAISIYFGMTRPFKSRQKKSSEKPEKKFFLTEFSLDLGMPSSNKIFLGREEELLVIHEKLINENILFLSGIGGIGKSEIAKQYAKKYKEEYNHVAYLCYHESLHRTISDLSFIEDRLDMDEEARFKEHFQFFKMLESDALVILDNFDTLPENDSLFNDFISLNCDILITTRSYIEDQPLYVVEEISSNEVLRQLFYSYAPNVGKDNKVIDDIIKEVHAHTLTVEMAAKTLQKAMLKPEELLNVLREEGIQLSNPNKIKVQKDAEINKDILYQHIFKLFRLQNLSEEEKFYLRHMILMPDSGISKEIFRKWMKINDFNVMNDLIEYGWIKEDIENARISIHPFIHEVVSTVEKPNFENCTNFLENILMECTAYGNDYNYYPDIISSVESICENIEFAYDDRLYLFFSSAMAFLDKYNFYDAIRDILDIMEQNIILKENYLALNIYLNWKGNYYFKHNENDLAKSYYIKALNLERNISLENAENFCILYHNLALIYIEEHDFLRFYEYIEKMYALRQCYQLPLDQDGIQQMITYSQSFVYKNEFDKAENLLINLLNQLNVQNLYTAKAKVYKALGSVVSGHGLYQKDKKVIEDGLKYLAKAKDLYLEHFPADHEDLKTIDIICSLAKGLL